MTQHAPFPTHQPSTQAQHAFLTCPADRDLVKQLADEAEHRLAEVGGVVTQLSYGITPKKKNGYIVLDAARGVPLAFFSWLREEPFITDYLVYNVPSFEQEQAAIEECGASWYEPRLEAPDLPAGYSLLSQPMSLDRPSDELWVAYAASDAEHEGSGVLVYGEKKKFFFFTAEEVTNITAYLLAQARPVLAQCSQDFLLAPQHAQRLALIKHALVAIEEGHINGER